MQRLEGKTIAVTGAGSGIGRAMALAFGREGAHVLVADIRRAPREGGPSTDELLRERGHRAEFVGTDVSRWSDVDALVQRAVDETGRLDVFVNNAALHHRTISKSLLETSAEDWDAMMDVNLRGTFFGCKRAIQQMLTQGSVHGVRGRVINIGSSHGIVGAKGKAAHCAIKAAVINLTRQIAVEYGPEGIVANALSPGRIVTGPQDDDPDTDDDLIYSQSMTPFMRLGTPADVAGGAVYLASDECSFVSGANLVIDGGFTIR